MESIDETGSTFRTAESRSQDNSDIERESETDNEEDFSMKRNLLSQLSRPSVISSHYPPLANAGELKQSVAMDDGCRASAGPEPMRVFVRVRPLTPSEIKRSEQTCVETEDSRTVTIRSPSSLSAARSDSSTAITSRFGRTLPSQGSLASSVVHRFTFTRVFEEGISQKDLFESGVLNVIRDFLSGQNCLMFAYGTTNSGKTFTIQGTPQDRGMLPRSVDTLFGFLGASGASQYMGGDLHPHMVSGVVRLDGEELDVCQRLRERVLDLGGKVGASGVSSMNSSLASNESDTSCLSMDTTCALNLTAATALDIEKENIENIDGALPADGWENSQYSVWVSFMEVYQEKVYDLLDIKVKGQGIGRRVLATKEDKTGQPYVKGLKSVNVRSAEEAYKVMLRGQKNLQIASTALNQASSRSHCIFSIRLLRIAQSSDGSGLPTVTRTSTLSFCDLAGSERSSRTHSTGNRLKEAGNINTSLLTLSRCISALRHNQTAKANPVVVPFRESKLTRLFQSFFCGHGRAGMIVNASPCAADFSETLHALKFSAIAKQVTLVVPEPIVPTIDSSSKQKTSGVADAKQTVGEQKRGGRLLSIQLGGSGGELDSGARTSIMWATPGTIFKYNGRTAAAGTGGVDESEGGEEEEDLPSSEREQELLEMVETLKVALLEETRLRAKMERALREELCVEMAAQLSRIDQDHQDRLQEEREQAEELYEKKLEIYTEALTKRSSSPKELQMNSSSSPKGLQMSSPSTEICADDRWLNEQKDENEEIIDRGDNSEDPNDETMNRGSNFEEMGVAEALLEVSELEQSMRELEKGIREEGVRRASRVGLEHTPRRVGAEAEHSSRRKGVEMEQQSEGDQKCLEKKTVKEDCESDLATEEILSSLNAQLRNLKQELEEKTREVEECHQTLEEAGEVLEEKDESITSLKTESDRLREQVKGLNKEVLASKELNKEVLALRKEAGNYKKREEALVKEVEKLKGEKEGFQGDDETVKWQAKALADQKSLTVALKREREVAVREGETLKSSNSKLENKVGSLQREVASLQKQMLAEQSLRRTSPSDGQSADSPDPAQPSLVSENEPSDISASEPGSSSENVDFPPYSAGEKLEQPKRLFPSLVASPANQTTSSDDQSEMGVRRSSRASNRRRSGCHDKGKGTQKVQRPVQRGWHGNKKGATGRGSKESGSDSESSAVGERKMRFGDISVTSFDSIPESSSPAPVIQGKAARILGIKNSPAAATSRPAASKAKNQKVRMAGRTNITAAIDSPFRAMHTKSSLLRLATLPENQSSIGSGKNVGRRTPRCLDASCHQNTPLGSPKVTPTGHLAATRVTRKRRLANEAEHPQPPRKRKSKGGVKRRGRKADSGEGDGEEKGSGGGVLRKIVGAVYNTRSRKTRVAK